MKPPRAGGGWHAIGYTLAKAGSAGFLGMWHAMRSRNACKTCALGMGGQRGGMVNEAGHFPEFCKKSIQAAAADLQPAIPAVALAAGWEHLEGLSPRQLERLGRLTVPVVAEAGAAGYRPASWEEAFSRLAARLQGSPPEQTFFYFSGRSSNEAGFLLQLFARIYGTNNVNNCSFYCHQASGVGLGSMLGSSAGTVQLADLEHTDLVVLIGGNPASNHPRLMRTLMDLKRRGGEVVVVNPLREVGLERFKVPSDPRSLLFGTTIADLYLQPHIGGDIALFAGLARELLERGAVDLPYLAAHTSGWSELEQALRELDPAALAHASGVPRAQLMELAERVQRSRTTVFAWAMGITHHLHGVDNVRMIADLALMRGMVGRQGGGLLPLRGHSNIQGLGTVGVTPKLKDEVFHRLESHFRVRLPQTPGLDTMASMERAHAGEVRAAWCLGGNLFGSNPDPAYATAALGRIDQLVYLNTTLNTGHIHGRGRETWILPVRARDEEAQPTTQESMFSYVRLSDGGPARHAHMQSEVQIISAVARRVLGDTGAVDWRALESHGRIRETISAIVPGLEQLASLDTERQEFHIPGRVMERPGFARMPDGRARLAVVGVPAHGELGPRQLRLMTLRSEGQFNTVVYEDYDRYRGQDRRDVIMMARADRERLGLRLDQRVRLRSGSGEMRNILVREVDIRAGNAAMYYPEANVLVSRAVDPESRTPAFKHAVVEVEPEA